MGDDKFRIYLSALDSAIGSLRANSVFHESILGVLNRHQQLSGSVKALVFLAESLEKLGVHRALFKLLVGEQTLVKRDIGTDAVDLHLG